MKTIFFHCLRYFSRSSSSRLVETHFSVQKKKYCFLLRTFFPAGGNHYLNYREAYLKLLSLLLTMIFFNFPDIPANVSSFFRLVETYSWIKSLFLLVETDFISTWNSILLFGDFSPLVETIEEIQFLKNKLISANGNWFSGSWKPIFSSIFRQSCHW